MKLTKPAISFAVLWVLFMAIAVWVLFCAETAEASLDRSYQWAHGGGEPAVHWEVQYDIGDGWVDAGTVTTAEATVTVPDGVTIIIQVRGVDAAGRTGPWSVASLPAADLGPPEATQPALFPALVAGFLLLLAFLGVRKRQPS